MNKSYFDSRGKSHELIAVLTAISHRSEERRVGKECRL